MPQVVVAPAFQRFVPCAPHVVRAETVGAALDAVFADVPALRDYVLDDQGHVRKHVALFVDGRMIADRRDLSLGVAQASEIYVAQALSGG